MKLQAFRVQDLVSKLESSCIEQMAAFTTSGDVIPKTCFSCTATGQCLPPPEDKWLLTKGKVTFFFLCRLYIPAYLDLRDYPPSSMFTHPSEQHKKTDRWLAFIAIDATWDETPNISSAHETAPTVPEHVSSAPTPWALHTHLYWCGEHGRREGQLCIYIHDIPTLSQVPVTVL